MERSAVSMQALRNQRSYTTMRAALAFIAGGRHDCDTWDSDDYERFARECMQRAREALAEENSAAETRRRPRHAL